jgi:hypothetical protein
MEDYQAKYETLVTAVKEMLEAQQAYFKSNKDIQLLKVSKGKEARVKELVTPKVQRESQGSFEWLAQ